MESYLITIRAGAKRYIAKEELNQILKNMITQLKGIEWSSVVGYELDSDRRWHLHTMCTATKIPYLKRFNRNSIYVHFQKRTDEQQNKKARTQGAVYVSKIPQDKYSQEELDWLSYARYNCLFQDSS